MTYPQRYFAFVDVLGFGALIRDTARGQIPVATVRDILEIVHKGSPSDGLVIGGDDFRHQSISDAVAISAASTDEGLLHVLHALKVLAFRLLDKGYFVRGALVHGDLVHEDKAVFGPALIEAYRLESTVAKFPRIMITRDVMQRIAASEKRKTLLEGYVHQADDGPYFVNVLQDVVEAANEQRRDVLMPQLQARSQIIALRLDEAVDNPAHFEKVQWFAKYWNAKIPNWSTGLCSIKGPGLDRPVTLAHVFALSGGL